MIPTTAAQQGGPPLPLPLAHMQNSSEYGGIGHPSRCQRAASPAVRAVFPPPIGSQTSGKGWIHAA